METYQGEVEQGTGIAKGENGNKKILQKAPREHKMSISSRETMFSRLVSPVLFQPHNPKSGPFRSVTK